MASSKKKSSKKPAAKTKKKAAPAKATKKAKAAPKKKAGKPAPKAVAAQNKKAKPAARKPAARKPAAKKPAAKKAPQQPTPADSWGNASMAPKVAAATPPSRMSEPSMSPPHALHDHAGGLVSAVDEEEELAERIHGGEEAVKNEDADDDSGSPRLDDREDEA